MLFNAGITYVYSKIEGFKAKDEPTSLRLMMEPGLNLLLTYSKRYVAFHGMFGTVLIISVAKMVRVLLSLKRTKI